MISRRAEKAYALLKGLTLCAQEPFRLQENEIQVRHYSKKTLKTYTGWLRAFQAFTKSKPPLSLCTDDVNEFLTFLAVKRRVSSSTQNQAFNAQLFFFRHVLKSSSPARHGTALFRSVRKMHLRGNTGMPPFSYDGSLSPCIYVNLPIGRADPKRWVFGNVHAANPLEIWGSSAFRQFRERLAGGDPDRLEIRMPRVVYEGGLNLPDLVLAAPPVPAIPAGLVYLFNFPFRCDGRRAAAGRTHDADAPVGSRAGGKRHLSRQSSLRSDAPRWIRSRQSSSAASLISISAVAARLPTCPRSACRRCASP